MCVFGVIIIFITCKGSIRSFLLSNLSFFMCLRSVRVIIDYTTATSTSISLTQGNSVVDKPEIDIDNRDRLYSSKFLKSGLSFSLHFVL